MASTLIEDKESLYLAINTYTSNPESDEALHALMSALVEAMNEHKSFLVPKRPQEEMEDTAFPFILLKGGSEQFLLPVFTGEEETANCPYKDFAEISIEKCCEIALETVGVVGIAINLGCEASCQLGRIVLRYMLDELAPNEDTYKKQNALLEKAIHFAVIAHSGQVRKGTTVPYITHPLATMAILTQMKADTNLLIAGVLHDVLEDTDTNHVEIAEIFGSDIYKLVASHTEDKSQTWAERKNTAILHLEEADKREKLLVLADKVANLRSLYADYSIVGEELWERFNAPKDKQAWYYSKIMEAMSEMQFDDDACDIYEEMKNLCGMLFGKPELLC